MLIQWPNKLINKPSSFLYIHHMASMTSDGKFWNIQVILYMNYFIKISILYSLCERSTTRLYIVTQLIYLTFRVYHVKCQAGLITSWNQDCLEKYQQLQKCRYHSNGRKQRGTEEPRDEGERGEWKSWLKILLSKNKYHGIQSHHFMVNIREKSGSSDRFYFLGHQNHCRWWP